MEYLCVSVTEKVLDKKALIADKKQSTILK